MLPGGRIRLAAVLAVVIALLAAAIVITVTRNGGNADGKGPSGAHATPTVPPGFIDSARTDADRVVAGEFFGTARVTGSGTVYRRLAVRLDDGCPQLSGNLSGILTRGRCRQLVRALLVTEPAPGRRHVLIGMSVFVLDEKATAQLVEDAVTAGRGGVAPLPVPAGSVPGIRITGPAGDNSWRAATVRGHYTVFMQAAYVDGTEGSADDELLRNAIADMQMLAVDPIASRTITGRGPRNPAPASSSASPSPHA